MRHHWMKVAVALAAYWSLPSALAQQGRVDPVARAIDTNGDGSLDSAELKSAAASIRKLDADGDGTVSINEVSGRNSSSQGRGVGSRSSGSRLGGYTTPPPANDVPDHPFNIIVGRLTDDSGTIRVLFHSDVKAYVSYGDRPGRLPSKTNVQALRAGVPFDFVIDSLAKNTRYFYRVVYQSDGRTQQSDEFTFHTQRDKDSSFVFTVQADSHLDENTSGEVYLRTLDNALADQPDFPFALGLHDGQVCQAGTVAASVSSSAVLSRQALSLCRVVFRVREPRRGIGESRIKRLGDNNPQALPPESVSERLLYRQRGARTRRWPAGELLPVRVGRCTVHCAGSVSAHDHTLSRRRQ